MVDSDIKVLDENELLDKLEAHGITLKSSERERNIQTIKKIGYYKLKEFAVFYSGKKDREISFEDLLSRYYYDKALRMGTLHAIEDIEIYFHNCMGELLARKYGPFGYLSFFSWCDRNIDRDTISKYENEFKSKLKRKIRRSGLPDLTIPKNIKNGFPTVWLTMELLMFGELVFIFKNMSPKNKRIIARKFNTTPNNLLSWLECLNLIRNICCHNSDLIDIKLRTKPITPIEYQENIYSEGTKQTDRVAIALLILKHLMDIIDRKYDYKLINDALCKIMRKKVSYAGGVRKSRAEVDVMNSIAHELGFKSAADTKIFPSHFVRRSNRKNKKGKRISKKNLTRNKKRV